MDSYGMAEIGLSWLWRASWQASILALLVLAMQWFLRARLSPGWRFALWWLVLARLILPVAPPCAWSVYNLAREPRLAEDPMMADPFAVIQPVTRVPVSRSADLRTLATGRSSAASPLSPGGVVSSSGSAKPAHPQSSHKPSLREWLFPAVGRMWVAGALFFVGRLVLGSLLLTRTLRDRTVVADEGILGALDHCRKTMGVARAPEVLATSAVDSPALFGLFRCRLLVPASMVGTFSLDEWRHVFLHELAHIRRRDVQVNWVMVVLQSLHWFNPLVWFACHRMRADRELACDAAALAHARENETKAYGRTIIKLLAGLSRPAALPGLVGILEDKNQIKQRIRMIACFKKSQRWPVLAAMVLAALSLFTLTDAQIKPSPEPTGEVKPSSPGALPSDAAVAVRPAEEGHDTRVRTNAMFLLSLGSSGSRALASTRSPDAAKTNRVDSLRIESDEYELSPGQAEFRGGVKATQFAGDIAKGVVSCARLTLKLSTNGNGIEHLLAENEVQYEPLSLFSTNGRVRKLICGRLEGEVDQGSFVRLVARQRVAMEVEEGMNQGGKGTSRITTEEAELSDNPRVQEQNTLRAPAPWRLLKHPDWDPLTPDRPEAGIDGNREVTFADAETNRQRLLQKLEHLIFDHKRLEQKLDQIIFDQFPTYPTDVDMSLGAFLKELAAQCRAVDPDPPEVRFVIGPVFEGWTAPESAPGTVRIDPRTGFSRLAERLSTLVTVRIHPALHRVRLREVLDTMTRVYQIPGDWRIPGLKYSVEDQAIVVSLAPGMLHSQTFKVDPNLLLQRLEDVPGARPGSPSSTRRPGDDIGDVPLTGPFVLPTVNPYRELHPPQTPAMDLSHMMGGGGGGVSPLPARQTETRTIQDLVRRFFGHATGINFGRTLPRAEGAGGKDKKDNHDDLGVGDTSAGLAKRSNTIRPMFYNDRTGILFVRATLEELDLVEKALETITAPPMEGTRVEVDAVLLAIRSEPDGTFERYFPVLVSRPSVTMTSNGRTIERSADRFAGVLGETQFQALEELASQRPGFERIAGPSLRLVSGGKCLFQPMGTGLQIAITPETKPDSRQIGLEIDLTLAARAGAGAAANRQPPTQLSIHADIQDGETTIVGKLTSSELGLKPGPGGKETVYTLCITPRIVAARGEPVKEEKNQTRDSGTSPGQK